MVHDEASMDLAGIDQVQRPLLFRPEEQKGVVGLGDEERDFQGR